MRREGVRPGAGRRPLRHEGEFPVEPGLAGGRWRLVAALCRMQDQPFRSLPVNNVIYIVGLVVVVLAVLSFFGLR